MPACDGSAKYSLMMPLPWLRWPATRARPRAQRGGDQLCALGRLRADQDDHRSIDVIRLVVRRVLQQIARRSYPGNAAASGEEIHKLRRLLQEAPSGLTQIEDDPA
jgi:hypothetical protein